VTSYARTFAKSSPSGKSGSALTVAPVGYCRFDNLLRQSGQTIVFGKSWALLGRTDATTLCDGIPQRYCNSPSLDISHTCIAALNWMGPAEQSVFEALAAIDLITWHLAWGPAPHPPNSPWLPRFRRETPASVAPSMHQVSAHGNMPTVVLGSLLGDSSASRVMLRLAVLLATPQQAFQNVQVHLYALSVFAGGVCFVASVEQGCNIRYLLSSDGEAFKRSTRIRTGERQLHKTDCVKRITPD
jgi:hypothetical protein